MLYSVVEIVVDITYSPWFQSICLLLGKLKIEIAV